MVLDAADSDLLKAWVIKKLEDISDADSDVLADYVLALAKSDEPESVAKASCADNLKDFLADSTGAFVDQLFYAIKTRSYDPGRPASKPTAVPYHPPRFTSTEPPGQLNGSKKRSHHDWDKEEQAFSAGFIPSFDGGDRPMKHARRGGRGHDQRGRGQSRQPYNLPQIPPIPTPTGMPSFNLNDPTQFAMQQLFGGMPGLPISNGTRQRCFDYDVKGFCAAGSSCPYDHGNDPVVIPGFNQQYDPRSAALSKIEPSRTGYSNFAQADRGRGRGGSKGRARGTNNFRGGGRRSLHSQLGPSRDPANTTIVVESIPEEKCNEDSVHEFFSEFGTIDNITAEPEKKLALVKYDSHSAAKAAYESPKVVFDNRFVKVFWYKTDGQPNDSPSKSRRAEMKPSPDEEMQDANLIDPVELAKKQEEAQRKHDEARKQREEVEKQRLDVDAQLKAKEAERRKIADLIAKKARKAPPSQADTPSQNGAIESEQTKGLKAQLAKLEAEAKSLGLNPDETTTGAGMFSSHRGRGGFRGRPRGRGYYLGYRGGHGIGRGGAVMRLDNRPKTVAVTLTNGSYYDHEEALRQFLLFNNLDSASLAKHSEREDTALIIFSQRFEGENFMAVAANSELLHIGKVELSWYKPEDKNTAINDGHEMDAMGPAEDTGQPTTSLEAEAYSVAEDEDLDHWS